MSPSRKMVWPFLNWTGIAQSVNNASCVGFIPARNGWSATRVAIGSSSVFLVFVGGSSSVFIGSPGYFFSSNEFVFFLTGYEHGTRRGSHHSLGGAADRKMFPAGVTVGGDNDKIDIARFGRFHDFMRG